MLQQEKDAEVSSASRQNSPLGALLSLASCWSAFESINGALEYTSASKSEWKNNYLGIRFRGLLRYEHVLQDEFYYQFSTGLTSAMVSFWGVYTVWRQNSHVIGHLAIIFSLFAR